MQLLHRYLLARFEVETLDDYLHLLTLFRNTQAIETLYAHRWLSKLADIVASIEMARHSVLARLQQCRTPS